MSKNTAIKYFKEDLAIIYSQALEHYNGNKKKAQDCVQIYCKGLNMQYMKVTMR